MSQSKNVNGLTHASIKETDKADLPIFLQRIEAHLVLKVITAKIAKQHPKIPLYTIHDSIVTTDIGQNVQIVREHMEQELEQVVGIAPMLREERWSQEDTELNLIKQIYEEVLSGATIKE